MCKIFINGKDVISLSVQNRTLFFLASIQGRCSQERPRLVRSSHDKSCLKPIQYD
ncbi:hypothetical protein EJB05_42865 [Eragrostis curvula]|uniref:Uncharacterized protein n=1 Tax=Eragrostis curvula TaxID=38414 RepID=A0A5J9TDD5_9POAL|nr:hypothetical protein EJB05_42865 [Eragrostis curvula]